MKKNRSIMMLMALIAGFLLIGTSPATAIAEETEGIFESGDTTGVYDEQDYTDDWWYDTYSYEENIGENEIRGYYGAEKDWDWYDYDYYDGIYDDTWNDNDWFFDTYDDSGEEGFWDI